MSRGLYALGFVVVALLVGLSSCVRIQVHVNAPTWLSGDSGEAALAPATPAPPVPSLPAPTGIGGDESAHREAAQRAQRQKQDNLDALINGAVRVASDVQAWMLRPRAFGGGDGAFTGVSLEQLGYITERDGSYLTLDGRYRLERVVDASLRVRGTNERFSNEVVVHVTGARVSDLRTEIVSADGGNLTYGTGSIAP